MKSKKLTRNLLILKIIEESFGEKFKNLFLYISLIYVFSSVIAFFYSFGTDLYTKIMEMFSILSNVYAILVGFNISAIIFIVSFLFKESLNNFHIDKEKLNLLYSQIVNSFMLSTFINISVIVLGLFHLVIVNSLRNFITFELLNRYLIHIFNTVYISIWLFLILSSLIVFIRCLVILTRLLRLAQNSLK